MHPKEFDSHLKVLLNTKKPKYMKGLTITEKQVALKNAMTSFGFPEKYNVHVAGTRGKNIFALASNADHGGINTHSMFMTYEEFNSYLRGWYDAKMKKF